MTGRVRRAATLAMAAGLTVAWVAVTVPASAATRADYVTVTQVLVDRLGGVNVSGEVSCAGLYDQIAAGGYTVPDEQGNPVPVVLDAGDLVNLYANNDNYTVSQPAGRRAMIQVTHESSRMNPCFVQYPFSSDGTPYPDWVACNADGSACAWHTDAYGYDPAAFGPLFDYSPDGRFKTGLLNVTGHSLGVLIQIAHLSESPVTWDTYYVPEGTYSMTSTSIRAASYRTTR
jgi:hypothetical protein